MCVPVLRRQDRALCQGLRLSDGNVPLTHNKYYGHGRIVLGTMYNTCSNKDVLPIRQETTG